MKNNKSLKVAILSISFLLMLRLTISPALAEIGKAFPSVSEGTLMMMVALPSLIAIPFGFFSGIIAGFVKKKTILYVALVLFLIGGMGPVFANSFTVVLALRCLLGAGTGLFLPFAAGLIADFFTGEERTAMFGLQNSAVAIGNVLTSILAGALATISWKLSFLIYAFAFITLILVIFKIPEPVKVEHVQEKSKAINGKVMFVCFSIFIYAIIYFSFFGYLSFVVENHNLGNSASTGLATMLMTATSMVMGFGFGKLVKLFKKFSVFVAIIVNAIGFFTLSSATSMGMIILGAVLIGIGFGFIMPLGIMKVTEAAPKSAATFANGLFMTFINIGTAISPALLVLIGKIFSNTDGKFIYLVCSIGLIVGAVIALGLVFAPKKVAGESIN